MQKYFFTVVIPVYNSAKFLEQCIRSVINQSFKNVEIILINDASSDGSQKICERYNKNYNLRLINNVKNLGVGISRNRGLKASSGRYIIFLDSDDYLLKDSLKKLKYIIEKNRYPNVVLNNIVQNKITNIDHGVLKYFGSKVKTKNEFLSVLTRKKLFINECWRIVISKKLINQNKIFFKNIKIAEDACFVVKVFILMKSIIINKNKFLFHRSRFNSLKYSVGVDPAYAYFVVLIELCKYLKLYLNNLNIKHYLKLKILKTISNINIYFTLLDIKGTNQLSLKIREQISKLMILRKLNINLVSKNSKDMILKRQTFANNHVISSLKKTKFNFVNTDIFCASTLSLSIINILKKNKINIGSIYDDDPMFRGRKLSKISIKVLGKQKLVRKSIKKKLFLVCIESKKTFNNIFSRLLKKGFQKHQIIHLTI